MKAMQTGAGQKTVGVDTRLIGQPVDLAEGRRIRSTTVICVRRGDAVVMAADGQVSVGATVMKSSARKIRRLYNDKVLAGFAGSTADAFSLFGRFESKLEQYAGTWDGRRWSLPRTGGRIRCCVSWRLCWWLPTRSKR